MPDAPAHGHDHAAEARALALVSSGPRRVLEPAERFAEIVFGLVMVLTFTGTLRVAGSGREQVREMLLAALSCNVAWGIVDGVMFVVTSAVERTRRLALLRGVRAAGPEAARAIVRGALPPMMAAAIEDAEADRIVARLRRRGEVPRPGAITGPDLAGALACFVLTVAATFPPTIPFLVLADVHTAVHVSNAVAVASLFVAGCGLGNATGVRPWRLGIVMVLVGGALVGITNALGG